MIDNEQDIPVSRNMNRQEQILAAQLRIQEHNRSVYWREYDPFIDIRMVWRASTMRHLFHILPGQKILEIGAGCGQFTETLMRVTRGECEITAVVFSRACEENLKKKFAGRNVSIVYCEDFPRALGEERFDYAVAHHMLEDKTRNVFLHMVKSLLKPGGGLLLFEPNPWNPYYRLRRLCRRILPISWRRPSEPVSLNCLQIYSVLSEIGYTHIKAVPYDFLYSPVPKFLSGPAQHLSLIMENCPGVRNFAGSLYIWARNGFSEENASVEAEDLCDHPMFFNKISFVIPCHNEEMNIVPLIEGLKRFLGRYIFEIIIVDDNSKDATAVAAKRMAEQDERIRVISRKPPNGVGRALRDGIKAAQGDYVMIMDCDFQEIIPEMRDLFDALSEGVDGVAGSRFSRESVLLNYPFTKIIANRTFHALANLLLGKRFRDMTNNLKILKREAARQIDIEFPDYAANAETGLKPLLLGYRIKEVPISWINRSALMGLSSFKIISAGWNYYRLLVRLFLRKTRTQFFCKKN